MKIAPPRAEVAGFIAMDSDPAMIRYSNITLKTLIATAYRLDSSQILGGAAWLDNQKYDVAAKLPPASPKEQIPAMLQALLAERFKLAVHRESKDQRVYLLVVAKNGTKLKWRGDPDAEPAQQVRGDRLPIQILPGGIKGQSMDLGALAGALALVTGRQVMNRTGAIGTFDVDLKWTPEEADFGSDIFAAIQEQLGLRLEPGRAAVEMLVIDHAEQIPSPD